MKLNIITTVGALQYVHTGPARRQHQHTDRIYSHHTGGIRYNNKMILTHFIMNRAILIKHKTYIK